MTKLSNVVKQLKKERNQAAKILQSLDAALAALAGVARGKVSGVRHISAAGRTRIAAAQRARWAKFRWNGGKKHNVVSMPKKRSRSMISAAGRERIAAARKARWAKARAAQ